MRQSKENLPITMEVPGVKVASEKWGGMVVSFNRFARGTDFTPVLKGLKDNMCQCFHWVYLLKRALRIRYADGREETLTPGDLFYLPDGDTAWAEEDTELVEFSPQAEMDATLSHIQAQVGT